MKTIIRNWAGQDGKPDGGQACNDYFTIAWHRPSEEPGQNGAIVGEVLAQCYDWLSCENNNEPSPHFRSGIGYVIAFGDREIPIEHRMKTVKSLLRVCFSRLEFLQKQNEQKTGNTQRAIGWIEYAITQLDFNSEGLNSAVLALETAIVTLKDVNPDNLGVNGYDV
ncbi:MAG: hypothetical protein ACRCT2_15060 [Plesiomonas shigelloides]